VIAKELRQGNAIFRTDLQVMYFFRAKPTETFAFNFVFRIVFLQS